MCVSVVVVPFFLFPVDCIFLSASSVSILMKIDAGCGFRVCFSVFVCATRKRRSLKKKKTVRAKGR